MQMIGFLMPWTSDRALSRSLCCVKKDDLFPQINSPARRVSLNRRINMRGRRGEGKWGALQRIEIPSSLKWLWNKLLHDGPPGSKAVFFFYPYLNGTSDSRADFFRIFNILSSRPNSTSISTQTLQGTSRRWCHSRFLQQHQFCWLQ